MQMMHVQISPFLPDMALWALGGVAALLLGAGVLWRQMPLLWRGGGLLLLIGAVLNPLIEFEERTPIKDVVAVVLDRSGSQTLGERPAQMDEARVRVQAQLAALKGFDTRVISYSGSGDDGTQLFHALRDGLKDVSAERLAGVVMLTDGQVEDVPHDVAALGLSAPVHVLLTGHSHERDRRLETVEVPKFGIVGKDVMIKLKIRDTWPDGEPGHLSVRRDGEDLGSYTAPVDGVVEIPVRLEHAGANIVEILLAPVAGELTELNNKLIVSIEGVRDRVRVLLVSGAPNPGERSWRNVLKSDPNVDLVHYTILRFPNRVDDTPVNQLSLIGFPMDQLFSQDIQKFDLIIFDRYANQAPLPDYYFDNLANYVRRGGALLVAVGPDYAESDGLGRTSLAAVLPAVPSGNVLVQPYLPVLAEAGRMHPVTRGLAGPDPDAPNWAPFYRQIEAQAQRGMVLLSGAQNAPLLILSHEEKGRVALLLTDQLWLWARGIGGGGPHVELLRRVSHWLLKEPALEEEALRVQVSGANLEIERQSLKPVVGPIHLKLPNGIVQDVTLAKGEPGLWRAKVPVDAQGLYELQDGELRAFAHVGLANAREFAEVVSGGTKLASLVDATGGSIRRLTENQGDAMIVPKIIRMRAGGHYAGSDYIGLKRNELSTLKGLSSAPVALGFPGLLILAGMLLALWMREAFPNGFRRARPQD